MTAAPQRTIEFGGIELDPVEIAINGNAILGIKESGKSYLGTELGEIFFEAEIPFIAFDPIGIWHNMRYPGRGKGFPVVVAGGLHGDIPLTPANAPAIVEAAMQKGVSLVLDLFHPELSKADWRKIVRDCALLLLHKNSGHGLRHIFIEEAAEFVPQKVMDGQVYDAVERVIRMGGNSRLGCTLISPRSQEVNKAVLELCENMFLFRQRGKNALENLKKWLDVAGAEGKDVMRTLPSMPRGECWAWLGGSDTPVHVRVPEKRSFHPDRRAMQGDVEIPRGKAVNVSKFVGALQAELPKIEEEAKANDPKLLKKEIARLQTLVAGAAPEWPDQREAVSRLHAEGREYRARIEGLERVVRLAEGRMLSLAEDLASVLQGTVSGREGRPEEPAAERRTASPPDAVEARRAPAAAREPHSPPPAPTPPMDGELQPPKGRALQVLSTLHEFMEQHPAARQKGVKEKTWAFLTDTKRDSSTWRGYKAALRGFFAQNGDRVTLTDAGEALFPKNQGGNRAAVETGEYLVRQFIARMKPAGAATILEKLLESWPESMTRAQLAAAADAPMGSSTFRGYLAPLNNLELIEKDGQSFRLARDLMEW